MKKNIDSSFLHWLYIEETKGQYNPIKYTEWLENKVLKQLQLGVVSWQSEQLCQTFLSDGSFTSATKCQFCGKEKWEH